MSHNNYKKMIFQQTINWLTDLISHNLLRKLVYWLCHLIKASHTHCYLVVSWVKDVYRDFGLAGYFVPWSQRFFLIFLRERDQEQAAKRRQRVAKATRRERKTSGYLRLESHFHANDMVRIWPSGVDWLIFFQTRQNLIGSFNCNYRGDAEDFHTSFCLFPPGKKIVCMLHSQ